MELHRAETEQPEPKPLGNANAGSASIQLLQRIVLARCDARRGSGPILLKCDQADGGHRREKQQHTLKGALRNAPYNPSADKQSQQDARCEREIQ